ncbi:GPI anchored cell wall protein [Rasamsonia emersonii CBS 393.64]|uniref:GPI anchored cell wall protein n=1 Tax=Rasamsonia emersonii (strain ATCC 16479 / CBS 393.64 / IMI 116815) TaxID=1408163 RepID=A0A0F4YYE2_RASE3|nr:GPI anchored cell wall protein [Rasamsonia emersonii CBS 393.64]KKA22861.1 GPI anchored cell wall protein [Rasamsonia emersonii CBS 393.64]
MKTVGTIAAIAVGANALVARDATCCFGLTASGGASGTIGQLGDGQNRIGGGLPPAQFCIDSSGGIKDSSGRGCILTPPTSQFQCDQGAAPTNGFSISPEGTLLYQGSSHFVACETGDNGELNLYTNPPSNAVTGCKEITLTASGCKGQGSGSSSSSSVSPSPHSSASLAPHSSAPVPHSSAPVPHSSAPAPQSSTPAESSTPAPHSSAPAETSAPSSKSSAPGPQSSAPVPGSSAKPTPTETHASTSTPQPSASSSGCPTNLSGTYEYPHLIVPIDSSAPSKAYGTSYNGTVTSTVSSIFNFDIPASDSGKQCSLVFLFPEKKDLETSSYSFSGNGAIDFAQLQSPATQSTTYSNAPAVKTDYGVTTVSPGNSYRIATFSCPAGETVAFEMKNAGTTNLNFFEDYNPSPLGLYITVC